MKDDTTILEYLLSAMLLDPLTQIATAVWRWQFSGDNVSLIEN